MKYEYFGETLQKTKYHDDARKRRKMSNVVRRRSLAAFVVLSQMRRDLLNARFLTVNK